MRPNRQHRKGRADTHAMDILAAAEAAEAAEAAKAAKAAKAANKTLRDATR